MTDKVYGAKWCDHCLVRFRDTEEVDEVEGNYFHRDCPHERHKPGAQPEDKVGTDLARLKEERSELLEENSKLKAMVDNGLGPEDMNNDLSPRPDAN